MSDKHTLAENVARALNEIKANVEFDVQAAYKGDAASTELVEKILFHLEESTTLAEKLADKHSGFGFMEGGPVA